jgi:hypothetical protein
MLRGRLGLLTAFIAFVLLPGAAQAQTVTCSDATEASVHFLHEGAVTTIDAVAQNTMLVMPGCEVRPTFRLERGGAVLVETEGDPMPSDFNGRRTTFGGIAPLPGDLVRITVKGVEELVETYTGPLTFEYGVCRGSLLAGGALAPGTATLHSAWGLGTVTPTIAGSAYTLAFSKPLVSRRSSQRTNLTLYQHRARNHRADRATYERRQDVADACPGQKEIPLYMSCRPPKRGKCMVPVSCPASPAPCSVSISGKRVRLARTTVQPKSRRVVRVHLDPKARARHARGRKQQLRLTIRITAGDQVRQLHTLLLRVRRR